MTFFYLLSVKINLRTVSGNFIILPFSNWGNHRILQPGPLDSLSANFPDLEDKAERRVGGR